MTQYNSLNVKLPKSQLNKFKSAIKNETDVVLRLSSNMIGNSTELQILQQVANLRRVLLNIHQLILNCQKLDYLR